MKTWKSPLFDRFSRLSLLWLLAIFATAAAQADDIDQMRGDQVGWARLKTPSTEWMRHSRGDPILMHFLRDHTTLNIDSTWYVADVEHLDEMCKYPLLFSQSVTVLTTQRSRENLAEYVRRGGFLLVDACIHPAVTPDTQDFLDRHIAFLAQILPEARVVPLAPSHEIFHCFFHFVNGPPHTETAPQWLRHGLYGIEIGGRLAGIISFSGMQCGWDGMKPTPGSREQSMQMLVNIYVYAMLKGQ